MQNNILEQEKKHKNIIITGANSLYFQTLLTLIASTHRHNYDLVDAILVYDFGLSTDEISTLTNLKKVQVVSLEGFISENLDFYNSFSSPKTRCHMLKMYALYHSSDFADNIYWIDAGAMFIRNIDIIFKKIEDEDIFVVIDEHINKNFTHDKCREITKSTEKELLDKQIWSGGFGFKSNGKYQHMINESWGYSLTPGCIDGNEQNHRHDQSVLSILVSRYNCPLQDIDMFGYWTNYDRNLQKAQNLSSYIFVHRRGHDDKSGLIYK
jgi:hypothetical protein